MNFLSSFCNKFNYSFFQNEYSIWLIIYDKLNEKKLNDKKLIDKKLVDKNLIDKVVGIDIITKNIQPHEIINLLDTLEINIDKIEFIQTCNSIDLTKFKNIEFIKIENDNIDNIVSIQFRKKCKIVELVNVDLKNLKLPIIHTLFLNNCKNFNNNDITHININNSKIDFNFYKCINLKSLCLCNSIIDEVILPNTKMEELIINNCTLSKLSINNDIIDIKLHKNINLNLLDLDKYNIIYCSLSNFNLNEIPKLPSSIKEFTTYSNNITNIKNLENLENLEILSIFDDNVKDYTPILSLVNLKQLYFYKYNKGHIQLIELLKRNVYIDVFDETLFHKIISSMR